MKACGGAYTPQQRRKYYITGPQWAAAYQGQALFHAPTRAASQFRECHPRIRQNRHRLLVHARHRCDSRPKRWARTSNGKSSAASRTALNEHGLKCSMVTTETFHHAVWAASPAAEQPEVREYAKFRVSNTVDIGHRTGRDASRFIGRDRSATTRKARSRRRRCCAGMPTRSTRPASTISRSPKKHNRPTLKHCLEAKPFEPQAEIHAAHQRRHAGIHRLRTADASGDGGVESGVSARADVGRSAAGGAGAGPRSRANCGTSISTTAIV